MSGILSLLRAMANSSYSPELLAVISYANSQGYTLPSNAQLDNIDNNLIIPLKAAGLWTTHDVLYCLKNDGSSGFGGINLIDPSLNSFVPGGWANNVGGNSGLTGYTPDGSRNYQLNSASVASISVLVTGVNTFQIRANGNNMTSADSNGSIAMINSIGYVNLGNRTGTVWQHGNLSGTTLTYYSNTQSGTSSAGTAAYPPSQWIIGQAMEASSQIAIAGIGSSMNNATLKTIYENWFNNVP